MRIRDCMNILDDEDPLKHLIVQEGNSEEDWALWQESTDFGGLPTEEIKVKIEHPVIMIEDIFKSVRLKND